LNVKPGGTYSNREASQREHIINQMKMQICMIFLRSLAIRSFSIIHYVALLALITLRRRIMAAAENHSH